MSASTLERPATTSAHPAREGISTSRLIGVELQKMFDTRAGFWLIAGVAVLSTIATAATMVFGDRSSLQYGDFAQAVGIPTTVILPVLGALSVSSEWSQRTALSTFTMVPSRSRIVAAKFAAVVAVGLGSLVVALGAGALGNIVNGSIAGVTPVWDIDFTTLMQIVLADEIGMLMAFMFGALLRNSPAAIVSYFVYALVLPGVSSALADAQQWWADHAAWFDLRTATIPLYDDHMSSHDWAQLGVTTLIWLVIPLAIGVRLTLRSEVK